jgi:PAS domain S-box-containing protein
MNINDFLEEVRTAIVIVGPDFKIKYVNAYAQKLLSLTHGNLFNKSIIDLHTPEARKKIQKMFRGQEINVDEYPIIQVWEGPGNAFLLWAKLSKLYDEQGNLAYMIAIFYDLSLFTFHQENINHQITRTQLERIPIYENRKIKLLNVRSIVYIKGTGNYSTICREDGQRFLSTIHLNILDEKLPGDMFMRVHRSYIVNLQKIEEIILEEGNKYLLKLPLQCSGDRIYVSRRKYNEFRRRLML